MISSLWAKPPVAMTQALARMVTVPPPSSQTTPAKLPSSLVRRCFAAVPVRISTPNRFCPTSAIFSTTKVPIQPGPMEVSVHLVFLVRTGKSIIAPMGPAKGMPPAGCFSSFLPPGAASGFSPFFSAWGAAMGPPGPIFFRTNFSSTPPKVQSQSNISDRA